MKKNYFFIGLISASVLALSFEHSATTEIRAYTKAHRNSGGVNPGFTGAPGESALACAQCHSGGTTDGTAENLLIVSDGANPVTEYIPGNVYTVSLGMASAPAKKGFQATALDPSNNMAGNFASIPGVNVNGTARKYANHTNTSNTSSTIAWQWTWTAPATNVGDVTFYVASNKTNNNGNNQGDVIYLSQHVISVVANAGQAELEKNKNDFKAFFNGNENNLGLQFNSLNSGKVYLNLIDASGKSVFSSEIGESVIGANSFAVKLPAGMKNGVYFAHVFVHNTPMSVKVMIQK
jgi:hypothetical protein